MQISCGAFVEMLVVCSRPPIIRTGEKYSQLVVIGLNEAGARGRETRHGLLA